MGEIPYWVGLLLGGAGVCWFAVLALTPGEDRRRRGFGHLLWGVLFLYPGIFALFAGRLVYSGSGDEVPVADEIPAIALIATSVAAALAVGVVLLELNRPHRGSATIVAAGAVFALSSQVSLIAQGSSTLDLQSVFLLLLLVSVYLLNEDAVTVISRARYWLRGYVWAGLAAAIIIPSWALVPPEFGGRAWLPTRLIGFTSSTNYMALIAALAFILEIVNLNRSHRWRLYAGLALIACIWAQGRTGLAVVAVGTLAIILQARGGRAAR